jgi:hypothetical protein
MRLTRSSRKTPTRTSPRKNPASETKYPVTVIEAKVDVGFGNNLFLRGQGAGLSWERGVPLRCVDGKTWQWTGTVPDRLTFKLLLNDAVWSKGENLVAAPGQKVEVVPTF